MYIVIRDPPLLCMRILSLEYDVPLQNLSLVKKLLEFHIDGLECPSQSEMGEVEVEMKDKDNDTIRYSVSIDLPTF